MNLMNSFIYVPAYACSFDTKDSVKHICELILNVSITLFLIVTETEVLYQFLFQMRIFSFIVVNALEAKVTLLPT